MKKLLLLSNIGSPSSTQVADVRKYLEEFLMDPLVIDIPYFFRWILVKGIIGPRRSTESAKKYNSIWTKKGSPLVVNSQNFANQLQQLLGDSYIVKFAYRYGQNRIDNVIQGLDFKSIEQVLFVPMFPQYASATTLTSLQMFESSLQKTLSAQKIDSQKISIKTVPYFYQHSFFTQAWVQQILDFVKSRSSDGKTTDTDNSLAPFYLFSFHGLPERQVLKTTGCRLSADCCQQAEQDNRVCYRAQCMQTAQRISQALGLDSKQYAISFQSRLGQAEWLKPYTSELVKDLYQQGIRRIFVISPAFVTDCLETLEELGTELKHEFENLDNSINKKTQLELVPSLNDKAFWVEGFARFIQKL